MAWRTTFSSRVSGEPHLGYTRTHVGLSLPPRRGILRPAPGLRARFRGNRGRFRPRAGTSAAMLRCDSLTPKDAGMLRGARSPMTLSSCHRWRTRSTPSRTVSGLSGRFSPMLSPICGTCLSRPHRTKSRRLSGPSEVTSGRPELVRRRASRLSGATPSRVVTARRASGFCPASKAGGVSASEDAGARDLSVRLVPGLVLAGIGTGGATGAAVADRVRVIVLTV